MKGKLLHLYLAFLIFTTFIYIYIVQWMLYVDKEPEVHGWERTRSRNVSKYIVPNRETALLKPENLCMTQKILSIFVVSDVRNFHRRQIIRETWGNEAKFRYETFHTRIHRQARGSYLNMSNEWKGKRIEFKVYFILGRENSSTRQIEEEAKRYNDIFQEDFVEDYANLTLKSLFILKWANKPCLSFSSESYLTKAFLPLTFLTQI